MAKIYSDEEIERLSKNPCVNYVCRNRLSLTLEFKQQMYDIWVQKPGASTIRKLLLENGFDTREIGKDFYKNLARAFRYFGRPQRNRDPSYNAENVKFHSDPEMPGEVEGAYTDNDPDADEPVKECLPGQNALIQSGKFITLKSYKLYSKPLVP